MWRGVTRALAGYPSPVTGDEAKYQVEITGRKLGESLAAANKIYSPKFFDGDIKRAVFKYELKK